MFSHADAQRILARAAEIEGAGDVGPLTVDELRSIAGEAGFGHKAVERAIAEVQHSTAEDHRHPVQRSGFVVTQLSTVRTVPMEVGSDQLMRAVRLFQPYREGPASVSLGDDRITWRDRRGLQFAVTSAGGVTQIQVFVSRVLLRRGRWMGWVSSAANRLESLVLLVAAGELPARPRTTALPLPGATPPPVRTRS